MDALRPLGRWYLTVSVMTALVVWTDQGAPPLRLMLDFSGPSVGVQLGGGLQLFRLTLAAAWLVLTAIALPYITISQGVISWREALHAAKRPRVAAQEDLPLVPATPPTPDAHS